MHNEVEFVYVFAHNLTGIDVFSRVNEEATTVLQLVNGISKGIACVHRDHGTIGATAYLSFVRLVLFIAVSHDGFALRGSQYIRTEADNTA